MNIRMRQEAATPSEEVREALALRPRSMSDAATYAALLAGVTLRHVPPSSFCKVAALRSTTTTKPKPAPTG